MAIDYYQKALALGCEQPEHRAEVLLALGTVLNLVGRWDEAETSYRGVLTLEQQASTAPELLALAARTRSDLGQLERQRTNYEAALAWLDQARAGYQALGDTQGLVDTLVKIAQVLWRQGQLAAARELPEHALASLPESSDQSLRWHGLSVFGNLAKQEGDYATGRHAFQERLSIAQALVDKVRISSSLNDLADIELAAGDGAAAEPLLQQALEINRELGAKKSQVFNLNNLGLANLQQGDAARAGQLFREALTLARELGFKLGMVYQVAELAALALASSDAGRERELRAAQLLGAATAQIELIGAVWEASEHAVYQQALATLRQRLDEQSLARAWAEGQQLTLEQAVSYALEEQGANSAG